MHQMYQIHQINQMHQIHQIHQIHQKYQNNRQLKTAGEYLKSKNLTRNYDLVPSCNQKLEPFQSNIKQQKLSNLHLNIIYVIVRHTLFTLCSLNNCTPWEEIIRNQSLPLTIRENRLFCTDFTRDFNRNTTLS